ncbi:DUF4394 domain-containing protein [Singulisphaera sp. Ch08]|uniref:DUF4394 domain-containing protein n=1 Tax=Singulisphaera sp. Ch08 TaxID=3120278 RepID=A0AAU7CLB5_9BACT
MAPVSSRDKKVNSSFRDRARKPLRHQRRIGILEQCESRTLLTTMFGLTAASTLVKFDSAFPAIILKSNPITNIGAGETIQGIDFRPANRQLYALTTDANHTGRLYTIDTTSAAATLAATIDVPVTGTSFGLDFNPIPDRLRIVSDTDLNLRVNVATGAATADGTLSYLAGDSSAGQDPNVVGSAYSNNLSSASATTLYQIDSHLDILAIQSPPNDGTLTTVGALGVDASAVAGFDIQTVGGQNVGYTTLVVDNTTGLYQINLSTGAATLIAPAGEPLRALAIAPDGFSSKVEGSTVILTGSESTDTLVIDQSGGLLRNNQFDLGVAGYNSAFDFDSSLPGDQTVSSTDAAVSVFVITRGGKDAVTLGSASAPFSSLSASFKINFRDGQNHALKLDDSASPIARTIQVASAIVTGSGSIATVAGFGIPVTIDTNNGGPTYLTVMAGKGNDDFYIVEDLGLSAFGTHLDGGGGLDRLFADADGASVSVTLESLRFLPFETYSVSVNYAEIEQVNVLNVQGMRLQPVLPTVVPISPITAGTEFTHRLVAQFTDPDPGAKAADYQVTIQWGDGTSSAGTVVQDTNDPTHFYVYGDHLYSVSGHFTVTTTIHDTGGKSTLGGPVVGVHPVGSTWGSTPLQTNPSIAIYYHNLSMVTVTRTYLAESPVTMNSSILVIEPPIAVTGRLDAASDTGVSNQDGITNDNTPTFTGISSPGALIQIFNGTDPATRQRIASAVADANGDWQATVLNPLADGLYTGLVLEATSANGRSQATSSLAGLTIDTVAPTVTNLEFRRINGQINATFQDDRSGLDQAGITNQANYIFTGIGPVALRNRRLRITQATTAPQNKPTNAQVVNLAINNGKPLRAGRYSFAANASGIADLAGNALNGEFTGRFPSGNAQPGGHFVAGLRPLRKIVPVSTPNGTGAANQADQRQTALKKNAGNAHPAGPNRGAQLANHPHAAALFKAQGRKAGR